MHLALSGLVSFSDTLLVVSVLDIVYDCYLWLLCSPERVKQKPISNFDEHTHTHSFCPENKLTTDDITIKNL